MQPPLNNLDDAKRWFAEAGFGLFIHWGLYAIPAGRWRGAEVPFLGEWIMNTARIPIREYEPLVRQFNPKAFDAREWVAMAEAAGMRYLVFTSKHHDGFAMFRSDADPYNVVDATPFGRDVVGELAEACRDSRVRLALYYSQAQDWHEASAGNGPLDRGYKVNGGRWRTGEELLQMKARAKAQGCNLLLNVGPMADGRFPPEAVERMQFMADRTGLWGRHS